VRKEYYHENVTNAARTGAARESCSALSNGPSSVPSSCPSSLAFLILVRARLLVPLGSRKNEFKSLKAAYANDRALRETIDGIDKDNKTDFDDAWEGLIGTSN
jgi:hypothetical protein